jgi:hypothetical protein
MAENMSPDCPIDKIKVMTKANDKNMLKANKVVVCFGLSSTLSFVFSTIHSVDRPIFVLEDSFRFKIGMGNII